MRHQPMSRRLHYRLTATFFASWAFVAGVLITACVTAPPNLSPEATTAFNNLRVIKALDLLRDTAIAANEQMPPLLSTDVTRKVVIYHQSALHTIRSVPDEWKAVVLTGLDEIRAQLPDVYRRLLDPYLALVKTVIQEVAP